ncbi:Protein germ cell-less [Gryllus bimaculatus]|nr:Protein germ cell-less [Gryllus bimaculatus]
MGESWSKLLTDYSSSRMGETVRSWVGRKRKRDDDSDSQSESNLVLEKTMRTPKRKKLASTAQYIYQALFKEGKNSDIKVLALGKLWKLHRIYLCQSPYFASMFSGAWKEATEDFVRIEIVDPKINLDAMYIVLGSLYLDEVTLEPADVVSVLAAASLFQLDGLIDQCTEIMIETINTETVLTYYESSCEYGLQNVKEACFKWLLVNLLCHICDCPKKLVQIGVDLMTQLVKSPDLFVMQTEFSVYALLRYWVYLHVAPQWEGGSIQEALIASQLYFQERDDDTPFLLTKEGSKYAPPFRALRLRHLVDHHTDVQLLHSEHVLPPSWLHPAIYNNWNLMLRIDQGIDRGAKELTFEEFSADCLRCGRVIHNETEHVWRWTGFNFGLDLVWTCDGRVLKVKRNQRSDSEVMLSMQQRRHFMFRITLASLDEQRQIKQTQSTGTKSMSFFKNEEVVLLVLDSELTFPILVSVNLLTTCPIASLQDSPCPHAPAPCPHASIN